MIKQEFASLVSSRIMMLDGATGTELQKHGLPQGVCPELWVLENAHILQEIQTGYFEAGSDAVLTCSFGANRVKLDEWGITESPESINARLAAVSRAISPDGGLVIGELGPTGKFVEPFGPLGFEEAVAGFAQQVRGLVDGGVDLFLIETMMDIQEARAAVIAVRETCDLPVMASMTYDENGRTLMGTPPDAAIVTLQALGVDAVGCNCSTGPAEMATLVRKMREAAHVPILAKPNAGLPTLRDGKTVFEMGAEEFAEQAATLIEAGAGIVGGCCGTTAEHIAALKARVAKMSVPAREEARRLWLSSTRQTVSPGPDKSLAIVGERINPTGKKKLQASLKSGDYGEARRLANEQLDAGAEILDVNAGMPGIDEQAVIVELVKMLVVSVQTPLCIDSTSPEVVEAALRIYPGRALVNSISAEAVKLEQMLPIAAKYGAALLVLPLTDDEIPATAEGRATVTRQIMSHAAEYGYTVADVVVDGLVMTISGAPEAARETLRTLRWASEEFGANTILGLSNVSFGLPARGWLNSTFMAMAAAEGLTMVIANPATELVCNVKKAVDALRGTDENCAAYVKEFGGRKAEETPSAAHAANAGERAYNAVLNGEGKTVVDIVEEALVSGIKPFMLVNEHLIPAITKVGDLYETGEYFLPQLMTAASTMEMAFEKLRPLLEQEETEKAGKIVMATVKGDIHDIGKNIVCLMLRNHGFEVVDMGKDVAAEDIVACAKAENADIIGLSALMTTTMRQMRTVVELAKQEGLRARIMIGGAVITAAYAEEIGADGYSADAVEAVRLATRLMAGRRRNKQ